MSLSNEPINAEPSMDEILSSIRRILKDDEPVTVPPEAPAATQSESVMVLDSSMLVAESAPASASESAAESAPAGRSRQSRSDLPPPRAISSQPTLSSATPPGTEATDMPYEANSTPDAVSKPDAASKPDTVSKPGAVEGPQPILGARAAEAAAGHIGALVRTISADRNLAISRGGISIEEIVREEIRPMLKSWLDAHLPGLVERVVRAEIERLVGHPEGL